MVMTIGNRLPNDLFIYLLFIYLYIPLPIRGGSGEVGQREAMHPSFKFNFSISKITKQ
jgi:hypothetical protein